MAAYALPFTCKFELLAQLSGTKREMLVEFEGLIRHDGYESVTPVRIRGAYQAPELAVDWKGNHFNRLDYDVLEEEALRELRKLYRRHYDDLYNAPEE